MVSEIRRAWDPTTRPHCCSRSYDLAPRRYDDRIVTDIFRLQLLLAAFAGWVNRHQAQAIDYLIEANRVLKEQVGDQRLRLTDDQRRRLAAKACCPRTRPYLARAGLTTFPQAVDDRCEMPNLFPRAAKK